MAVVEVLNCGYSRDREMMHLLRYLFFIAEHFRMHVEAVHLPGKENGLANALTRDNIPHFLQAFLGTAKSPTHLPSQALALLVEEQPDWTSPRWTELLYRQGLAQSTQQAYASGKTCYLNFCKRLGVPPLPATEGQLCYFVGFLKNQGLRHQTVKLYLSAVRHL